MTRNRLWRVCVIGLIFSYLPIQTLYASSPSITQDPWVDARSQYVEALKALERGQTKQFNQIREQLKDYPLYPYLDYAYLRVQMKRHTPSQGVAEFLAEHPNTPLAPQLKHYWLRTLAKRGQWQRYLAFYDDQINSVELKCYALWAEYKTLDTAEALAKVEPLWLVGYSQPNACEPIFKVWREQYLTDELTWRRFSLAMAARKTQLARYLIRYMSPELQAQAKLYREIHFYPERLQRKNFEELDAKSEEILLHGIKRLARKDALLCHSMWEAFRAKFNFSVAIKQEVNHSIILNLAKQGHTVAFSQALADYPYPNDTALLEAGVEMMIRQQRWEALIQLIDLLPAPSQQMPQWQYWYGRAMQYATPTVKDISSEAIYTQLAKTRDYYGFLAADHLNIDYELSAQSYSLKNNFIEQLNQSPGMVRAKELFLLGYTTEARREWVWASKAYDADQHYAAAYFAQQLGWNSQAIQSAISAERWHDLNLRFPLAYQEAMDNAATDRQLDVNWLLAIARQESAMNSDAQSPKGASGLMQIMPSTAKSLSKNHGIKYRSTYDLLNPMKSIELASAYLKDLLVQFKGNSIYATAAYNAGPHRVSGWLKKNSDQPIDIWIESIPFAETRQYVKNVLAYSVIFAKLRQEEGFRMATAQYLSNLSPQLAATATKTN